MPKWAFLLIVAAVVSVSLPFTYLQLKARWEEAKAKVQQQTKLQAVRNNLILIAAAADTYFAQEPTKNSVTVAELKRWLVGALPLKSVEGEDYDAMVLPRSWETISMQLPSGQTVEWRKK